MRKSGGEANSRLRVKPLVACLLPLALGGLAFATTAEAATLPVTNCNDAGSGSLREALSLAHSGDAVDLTALACAKISLSTGALQAAVDNLWLRGPGAAALTIEGNHVAHRYAVITHSGHGTLQLDGLTITDDVGMFFYQGASGCIQSSGHVYLNRSTVSHCNAGGIEADGATLRDSTVTQSYRALATVAGDVTIIGSTISGNQSYLECGAMRLGSSPHTKVISNSTVSGNYTWAYFAPQNHGAGCIDGAVAISNSTIAFNGARSGFGGLSLGGGTVTIESSIFANNGTDDWPVAASTLVIGHNNLIQHTQAAVPVDTLRTDPLLRPLADNGGLTQTHALAVGSPAIDAGSNSTVLATDQRGATYPRIIGARADIGAFETQADFTGSWFDPEQAGHGLMLEMLPNNQLLALWFSFDPAGTQQVWFGGVGTYSGNTATITAAQPTGGRWIPNFNQNAIVTKDWGTLTFTFTDHDHGKVNFTSGLGFGTGSMNLTRLTNIAAAKSAVEMPIGAPGAVVADANGDVYFSSGPNRIYKVDSFGALTRVAGIGEPGYSGDGGPAREARFNFPLVYPELVQDPADYTELVGGLALDFSHNLYVADAYNNRVRKIDTNGIVTTVLGNGYRGNGGDGGQAALAQIYWPQGLAFDGAGNLFVASNYGPLRKILPNGIISTIANANCGPDYLSPGLCAPVEIAVDPSGNVFATDAYCRVREVRNDGNIFTVAGDDTDPSGGLAFTCGYSGDGGPATKAALKGPYSVAVDGLGNLYIADTGNDCIRKVNAAGTISTFAGKCTHPGFAGDGGTAKDALLNRPHGVAFGPGNTVYVADSGNNRVRRISADGIISTIAGNGGALDTHDQRAIGPAFTGNWFDPTQSGHGLMLEVLSDNRLLAFWFAFNPAGTEQSWFGGIGTYSGNTATINAVLPTGGKWIPNFDPASIVANPWGTLTFTFNNCDHGDVTFNSVFDGYGTGNMHLTRLTMPAGLACP